MKTNNGNGEHFTLAFLMDLGQKTQKIISQNANWNNGKLYFFKGKKAYQKKTQEKLVRLLCSNDKCHSRISIALT